MRIMGISGNIAGAKEKGASLFDIKVGYAKWHCLSCMHFSPDFYFLTQEPRLLGKMDPAVLECSQTRHLSVTDEARHSVNSTQSWPGWSWHQKRGPDAAVEERTAGLSRHLTSTSTDALN